MRGERVAKELQNKGYATYIPAEEKHFINEVAELLYNDVFQITVNYIRTYSPEMFCNTDSYFIVQYQDDKGNIFERRVKKLGYDRKEDLEYYKKKFEEIREEARIWLMKQNEVR